MTEQTMSLIKSLPNFADVLEAADGRGKGDWEIVRWENVTPGIVTTNIVQKANDLDEDGNQVENRFQNRTVALRFSANYVRSKYGKSQRTERDHWGVWRITLDDKTIYQTVLPTIWRDRIVGSNGSTPVNGGSGARCIELPIRSFHLLTEWAAEDAKSIEAVMSDAIKEYNRKRFFDKADAAYKALRSDPAAWQAELEERAEWDAVLMDGIDTDETWDDNGYVTFRRAKEATCV